MRTGKCFGLRTRFDEPDFERDAARDLGAAIRDA
jgi:hypothetical protein